MKLQVGLYGINGHQIHAHLAQHPTAELAAVAEFPEAALNDEQRADPRLRRYPSLDELLNNGRVQLVSLCSPRRRQQAQEAIRCLEAGKHVYAEKPCAMSESDLDAILETAARTGRQFHEMAGTAFDQPYLALRQVVQSGVLGTVVQVLAQKSYPYHDARPQDEDVDGGLLLQVGVHALRFIEHVAGVRIAEGQAWQTGLGNPQAGDLRMAASLLLRLENGGLASVVLNYLNFRSFGSWGNESLRIFGVNGFVEAVDGGQRTRLVLAERDYGPLPIHEPGQDYFDLFAAALLGQGQMPLSLDDELHPTRVLLRLRGG